MNKLDLDYQNLLKDILENGIKKETRNGGTISVFGRQIRHKMSEGFPLLTTKKMYFKGIVTELLWFLRGETSIEYLLENDCNIWTGDAYKNYMNKWAEKLPRIGPCTQEEFINKIKTDDGFAKKWGELGPIYGKQWRSWGYDSDKWREEYKNLRFGSKEETEHLGKKGIDQIANLINELKTNPDSRRLLVTAWNPTYLPHQVLPPCHYGFQVYTRELSLEERLTWMKNNKTNVVLPARDLNVEFSIDEFFRPYGVPTRAISLMWNQRSCDVPLGIPMNIASYGLLLMMIADEVNMIPEELIGNLGDCHIYLNQMDGVKEQIGREFSYEERLELIKDNKDFLVKLSSYSSNEDVMKLCDEFLVPRRTREPFELPTVHVRDGIHCSSVNDVILKNYQSHSKIYFPLSN